ncbi:hypothetical protein HHK36_031549 [Tetracentron sinense]|uniref:Wall-associated receptor kinase galacturonan-binding domain-containing protein n=1 Tax=Tetracentron sinense TaxID=13715 RepID=A0A835D1A5_TETSI|nr:hypothetical protein HHK36_031549 [Tetracentron sinense]
MERREIKKPIRPKSHNLEEVVEGQISIVAVEEDEEDSGCSNHMTGNRSCFVDLNEGTHSQVKLGDGKLQNIEGKGVIAVQIKGEAATASQSKPNCPEKCGSIDVPYPFGFGDSGCFLETGFELSCNYSVSPPMLLTGNISILNISLEQGTVTVNTYMAYNCYKSDNLSYYYNHSVGLIDSIFTFSDTRNMFTAIGCDTLAYISDSNTGLLTNVCASLCSSSEDVTPDSSCSGVGCCKTPIPKGQKKLSMSLLSINGHTTTWQFNPCSYAFLADKDWFNFSNIHLFYLPDRMYIHRQCWTGP